MDFEKLKKQFDEILNNIDSEDFKAWLLKKECCEFLEWCNEPISRHPNCLDWYKRVTAQAPDYNRFIIIGNDGKLLEEEYGKWLFTSEEVFEHYLKFKQNDGNNQS